jgi:hypothetical protein
MARGGKRQGAGRPKGSVGPKKKIDDSILREAAKAGMTPLEYMLGVMRACAETDPDRADKMAIAAAKYLHAAKTETNVTEGLTINITPFDASVG